MVLVSVCERYAGIKCVLLFSRNFSGLKEGLYLRGNIRLLFDYDTKVFTMRTHLFIMLLEAIVLLTSGRTDACRVPDGVVCEKICVGSL